MLVGTVDWPMRKNERIQKIIYRGSDGRAPSMREDTFFDIMDDILDAKFLPSFWIICGRSISDARLALSIATYLFYIYSLLLHIFWRCTFLACVARAYHTPRWVILLGIVLMHMAHMEWINQSTIDPIQNNIVKSIVTINNWYDFYKDHVTVVDNCKELISFDLSMQARIRKYIQSCTFNNIYV